MVASTLRFGDVQYIVSSRVHAVTVIALQAIYAVRDRDVLDEAVGEPLPCVQFGHM